MPATWLLDIAFVWEVSVCVCPPPGYEKLFMGNEARITNLTRPNAFQFAYMALAIDKTDGCGLSNEVHL